MKRCVIEHVTERWGKKTFYMRVSDENKKKKKNFSKYTPTPIVSPFHLGRKILTPGGS